jgi:hypothetical protein
MQACGKNKPIVPETMHVYDFSSILFVACCLFYGCHTIFFGFLFLQTRVLSRASLSFSKSEDKIGTWLRFFTQMKGLAKGGRMTVLVTLRVRFGLA